LSSHCFEKNKIIEIKNLQIQGIVINTTSIPTILSFLRIKIKPKPRFLQN
jgi:hypothetical protein